MRGRVLAIAGSDSGGGAGIQADIKTIAALGGYAATAITALTAQNSLGVHATWPVPPAFVRQQIEAVLDDIGADAVKIGMLGSSEIVVLVASVLADRAPGVPVVVDPVMLAKGGAPLLDPAALTSLRELLCPLAALLTPNVPEAEALSGISIAASDDMERAAASLLRLGPGAVLLKGGHMSGPVVRDLLATRDGFEWFERPRIETRHTHGTGCTLSSAVATGLAQGLALHDAVGRARSCVQAAIASAPGFGAGAGPLHHGCWIDLPE